MTARRPWISPYWSAAALLGGAPCALAIQRFPPPQFESGHELPALTGLPPRALGLEYLDVAILVITLALATWLVLRHRSRRWVIGLGICSLLYFGFYRKGCVCSIGSIQNLAQGIADPSFVVPWTIVAFGLVPLGFAVLFGRVFCSSVCPHGALQDLVLLRPVKVPVWLEHGLRLIAYGYLGLAVVFAATGGGYIICQYDPFVPIFRLNGSQSMVFFGVALLAAGVFVGRPYCRFLCPYGVLLGIGSAVSKWRVRITPEECTQCRLCEESCPFGAIHPSSLDTPGQSPGPARRRLAWRLALWPVLVAAGMGLGLLAAGNLARKHARVNLAERVWLEETGAASGTTDASAAYRATGRPLPTLFGEAQQLRRRYALAGALCGGWIGLVIGGKLVSLATRRRRLDYEADQVRCLACARCYKFCPQEHRRLQKKYGIPMPPEMAAALADSNKQRGSGMTPAKAPSRP